MKKIKKYYNAFISIMAIAKEKGLFHIITSSTLVKIVSFISALFLPRFLLKTDYGLLTYVDNVRNYLMLLNGLGVALATLRYCSNDQNDERKKGYFLSSIIIGLIFDVILIIASIVIYLIIPLPFEGAKKYLLLMSILPIFAFLFEDIQLLLRATFENKKYSILSFVYSFLMVLMQVGLAFFWGVTGVVYARYIAVIGSIFLGIYYIRKISLFKSNTVWPEKKELFEITKFGIVMLSANATAMILQLNETFIIAQILKDEIALAEYRVASYIIPITLFLVQSVAVFIFPYFSKHAKELTWVWSKFKKIFWINAIIMIPMHIVLILTSKYIILILFGEAYIGAIPLMKTLLIASAFQSILRIIPGNVLAAIGKEKFNLLINIIFMVIHVIIDIWAIITFGITGAAIAISIVYFVSGITMIWYLRKTCKVISKSIVI